MQTNESIHIEKEYETETNTEGTRETMINRNNEVGRETHGVFSNIIYLLYGILAGAMGIRIFFTLFIANRENAFADILYGSTDPLIAPFRSLFGLDTTIGDKGSRIEIETLVALVVYGLIVLILIKIINIKNVTKDDV